MWVKELSLENFRNFENLRAELSPGVNIVYGDNANGKTNFIEAVYFCATGRSQRASNGRELVRFGQLEAHMQVIIEDGKCRSIDAHLFRDGKKKGIAIDHIPIKKLNQLFGMLLVVIFTPEDLRIIKAGPVERRTFMDMELCQLSNVYYHALRQYHHALKQRNNLLKTIAKSKSSELMDTLFIWDAPLCEYGLKIMEYRAAFIEQTGRIAGEIHSNMTGMGEELTLTYRPQVADPSQYEERLKRNTTRDIALGSTSVGVHKDDIGFAINGNDTRIYGSQGQQRTAALSAKLAAIEAIKTRTGRMPVLLLDDVLSELDEKRQGFLLKHIQGLQTILTCTGVEDVLKRAEAGRVLRMENGELRIILGEEAL